MNKRTLNWIIFFMTAALVGLVVFQTYWIRGAIRINREKFAQSVHEALRSVSDQLEQQEVMYTLYNQTLLPNQGPGPGNEVDSAAGAPNRSGTLYYHKYQRPGAGDSDFVRRETLSGSFSIRGRSDSVTVEQRFDSNIRMEFGQFGLLPDTLSSGMPSSHIESLRQKSQMVTIVLDQLLTNRRSIRARVDPAQLDTLLRAAFRDRGIDLPYHYAVLNDRNRGVVMTDNRQAVKTLRNTEFKTGLFTRDVISSANKLAVYFPGQRKYLLGKIWLTLASSGLLLLTFVVCFAYALHTIVRQKKISEMKNDFINNMTHEFKTPISTVSLACEALRDEQLQRDDRFVNKYLGIIQTENARLSMQVERVLQIARMDRKDIKLKPEVLDLHRVVDEAVQNIRLQVEKRQGLIRTEYRAENPRILADEVHLANVVLNLLDNANKYAKNAPSITVVTSDTSDHVVLSVSDQGIGMPPDVRKRIFEKFYRVPTGNIHDVKGFGLGLAYVKTMVELMQGRIDVHSIPGKGSTFIITLPKHA